MPSTDFPLPHTLLEAFIRLTFAETCQLTKNPSIGYYLGTICIPISLSRNVHCIHIKSLNAFNHYRLSTTKKKLNKKCSRLRHVTRSKKCYKVMDVARKILGGNVQTRLV